MTAEIVNLTAETEARLTSLADVLDVLIRLHDREVDAPYLAGFHRHDLARWIAGQLTSGPGKQSAKALGATVAALLPVSRPDTLDPLSAEYADLYLCHGYRVSPSGSVWLTEDHLERQLPMFEVREWYDHYDITVPNWRVRADDHLVHELQFVALLCRSGTQVGATDAARFLDQHVLPWVPEFCRQALLRIEQPLYRATFELTRATLEELRDALQEAIGLPPAVRLAAPPKATRTLEEDAPYIPGLAESW